MNKHAHGMTLIEVMFALSILSIVMAVLFTFSMSFGDTAQLQHAKALGNDETRRALQALVPDLHQGVRSSINWGQLPGEMLSYSVPEDLDGNGTPVDAGRRLETSLPRIVTRDLDDINGDGLRETQLIAVNGRSVHVLANNLSPESEQPDENGVFGPAQDTNGNGEIDRGVWFESWGRGVRITIQTQGTTRKGHVIRTTLQEVVFPRN